MPTTSKVKKEILNLIPPLFQGMIYELGAGSGSLAWPIAKQCSQSRVIAIEKAWVPWLVLNIRYLLFKKSNLICLRENFYHHSLHDASIIICYLFPGAMTRLKSKFIKELKPGTLIISNTFSINSWVPIQTIEINDIYHTKVYLYQI